MEKSKPLQDSQTAIRLSMKQIERLQMGFEIWEHVINNPEFGLFVVEYDRVENRFLRVGRSSLKLLGYETWEMEGKMLEDFLHRDDVNATKDVVKEQMLKNKESAGFINRYRHKDGSYRLMKWYSGGAMTRRQFGFAEVKVCTDS